MILNTSLLRLSLSTSMTDDALRILHGLQTIFVQSAAPHSVLLESSNPRWHLLQFSSVQHLRPPLAVLPRRRSDRSPSRLPPLLLGLQQLQMSFRRRRGHPYKHLRAIKLLRQRIGTPLQRIQAPQFLHLLDILHRQVVLGISVLVSHGRGKLGFRGG